MPYNPGVQSIGGQLIGQGLASMGQSLGKGITQWQQNKQEFKELLPLVSAQMTTAQTLGMGKEFGLSEGMNHKDIAAELESRSLAELRGMSKMFTQAAQQAMGQKRTNLMEREVKDKEARTKLEQDKFKAEQAAPPPNPFASLSEGSRKDLGFAQRLTNSRAELDALLELGYDEKGHIFDLNYLKKPQRQLYDLAKADWIAAKLRKESGAVLGAEEIKKETARYFPIPGDTSTVIEAKRLKREQIERGLYEPMGIPGMDKYAQGLYDRTQTNFRPIAMNTAEYPSANPEDYKGQADRVRSIYGPGPASAYFDEDPSAMQTKAAGYLKEMSKDPVKKNVVQMMLQTVMGVSDLKFPKF